MTAQKLAVPSSIRAVVEEAPLLPHEVQELLAFYAGERLPLARSIAAIAVREHWQTVEAVVKAMGWNPMIEEYCPYCTATRTDRYLLHTPVIEY